MTTTALDRLSAWYEEERAKGLIKLGFTFDREALSARRADGATGDELAEQAASEILALIGAVDRGDYKELVFNDRHVENS